VKQKLALAILPKLNKYWQNGGGFAPCKSVFDLSDDKAATKRKPKS